MGIRVAQKFYAVRQGRQPGIYRTWPETQKQVSGFPNAQYKSFATEADAQTFLKAGSSHRPAATKAARKTSHVAAKPVSADITVYTDGGSRNTGNVAGGHVRAGDKAAWAYRIELADEVVTDSAGEWGASNNRMEIMAFLRALQQLAKLGRAQKQIVFVLDSRYVLNAITQNWLAGWKRRGWKRSAGPLANAELWQEVDGLLGQFTHLNFNWTKGHATNQGNVFVDQLLNTTMDQMTAGQATGQHHVATTPTASAAAPKAPTQPTQPATPKPAVQPASQETVDRSVAAIREILRDAGMQDNQ